MSTIATPCMFVASKARKKIDHLGKSVSILRNFLHLIKYVSSGPCGTISLELRQTAAAVNGPGSRFRSVSAKVPSKRRSLHSFWSVSCAETTTLPLKCWPNEIQGLFNDLIWYVGGIHAFAVGSTWTCTYLDSRINGSVAPKSDVWKTCLISWQNLLFWCLFFRVSSSIVTNITQLRNCVVMKSNQDWHICIYLRYKMLLAPRII